MNQEDGVCASTLLSFSSSMITTQSPPSSPESEQPPESERLPPTIPLLTEDDCVFPVQKISAIMERALPPGAVVSDDAKRAVQRCVCEFICFLTSEASDRGGKARQVIDSEDILHAFRHLGFHHYSDLCQNYINRYRNQTKCSSVIMSKAVPENQPAALTSNSRRKHRTASSSTSVPKYICRGDNSPDIHAIRSLYDVSIEVASSLVYAWSSPILETALYLAASPLTTPGAAPTSDPATVSPMFLSRLQNMSMMSPAMLPEQAAAPPAMWLSGARHAFTSHEVLQSAARRGITVQNLILQNSSTTIAPPS